MNREEIENLIDEKIKSHEIRVGFVSGIVGVFFVFGIIHAIWLIKQHIGT